MLTLINAIVFIFPLFFLPILTDPVFMAKNFFLMAAGLVVLIVAGIRLFQDKKLKYSYSPLDFFVFLFALVNLASWLFLPQGARVRSLLQPLGLGTITGLTLLYLAIVQLTAAKKRDWILTALISSAAIAGLVTAILFLLPNSFFPWRWIGGPNWSPAGSSFILLQLLIPLLGLALAMFMKEVDKKGELKKWPLAPLAVVITVAVGLTAYQTLRAKPILLGWFSSWAVAVEGFKRNPVLGVGPGNFNTAFNLYRPPEFNRTQNWALNFTASRSWFLQVWAELGLIGLVVLGLVFLRSLPLLRKKKAGLGLAMVWLILLFLPGNLITLFALFIFLALVRGKGKEKSFSLMIGSEGKDGAPFIGGGLLVLLAFFGSYFLYRGFSAELFFYRSIKAASENRGGDTYNQQLQAIQANRFLPRYRIAFSQTNLALANGLAQNPVAAGDLTDDDRRQISQLMNQAVSEAKAAVALEPKNALIWENLAQTYRQLINAAKEADQWALTAYQQTIALDSLNPRLRVDYGGLLYGMNNFEEAAKQFEIAVNLKNDYANAWYNWAWALKQQRKLEEAVIKLQQGVNLVARDTPDYEKANKELEAWKKELGKETAKEEGSKEASMELKQPQPLPSSNIEQPIQLPAEAAPSLEGIEPSPTEAEPIQSAESTNLPD